MSEIKIDFEEVNHVVNTEAFVNQYIKDVSTIIRETFCNSFDKLNKVHEDGKIFFVWEDYNPLDPCNIHEDADVFGEFLKRVISNSDD